MKRVQYLSSIAAIALVMPAIAQAQAYGPDDAVTGGGDRSERSSRDERSERPQRKRATVTPYIEVSQVVLAELSPNDDVVTFSQVAAGVDASVQGRNNGGSVSLRYERNIGYGDAALDSDTVTGIARGYASVVPQVLTVEAGALAARTQVDNGGGASLNPVEGLGAEDESRIYSAYAGPNLATKVGEVAVSANYRFGYTRVEAPDAVVTTPGGPAVDVFDDSTTHSANASLGVKPNTVLPVGLGAGAGFYQEDISNLDQRVRDVYVRGDVTVPVTSEFAVVGGVGYEDVKVSSRDAVLDAGGAPVIDADGRFVTDTSAPRQIAFETDGLIWDVGVVWRPSRRTAFEAHYGRRYDSDTYYGSFAYAPNARSSVNLSVYDGVAGFGGVLNNALVALPTNFEANRNPLTGDLNGCVTSLEGGNCLGGALGSVRSAVFRSRGGVLSYSRAVGSRMNASVGIGYDRRTFIAAQGTVLAGADGLSEESFYGSIAVSGELGRNAGFSVNAYANYLTSDFTDTDATILGASAAYRRYIYGGLSARAAVALDYLNSEAAGEDLKTASALVGLRYDF
ncbi:preprotein translocase subunit YajC [Parerythrobacter jejuensis]|uniref:Preprotein translocase subunit YajC n=2 Tax=Parerythrobacter jejuensis TaxID=795812 RepID=A0A845AVI1_9SPHN|nr:preprotein translocase subunit YajC [Parerythrobacter jejuensis]MXP32496.1 preprotein translocase subunit YajC [Parerythrobacter jejuensis]